LGQCLGAEPDQVAQGIGVEREVEPILRAAEVELDELGADDVFGRASSRTVAQVSTDRS
jgi:hypothetical protein